MLGADLHLGHRNIHKYRPKFATAEEHHEVIFDNFASQITKRDSVILLGDVAFTPEWVHRLAEIPCQKMTIVLGNHDTERDVTPQDLADVFHNVTGLLSKNGVWMSHCPIHPDELRGKKYNFHGHTHSYCIPDTRYVNICVEHWDYGPISFQKALEFAEMKVIEEAEMNIVREF